MAESLTEWFECGLSRSTHNAALRIGTREWSYHELHTAALRWAGRILHAREIPNRRIGLMADRDVASYIGMLAIAYAGCTPVPLQRHAPATRNLFILEDSGVGVMLVDLDSLRDPDTYLDSSVEVLEIKNLERSEPDAKPLREPRPPADEAYVLYTSGSTGRPKGVPIRQASVRHHVASIRERFDFGASDVFSQTFDFTFDLAMFDMWVAWGCGANLVMTPSPAVANLPRFVAGNGISVWFSVPSVIDAAHRARGLLPRSMPGLRWSLFCGESLAVDDARRWQAAAPNGALVNLYGPTELTIACSSYRMPPLDAAARSESGIVSIGTLFPGLSAVLIGENGDIREFDGELCVSGPQRFDGYVDPGHDEGRFLEHAGRTWYRTGDRVRLVDGHLMFLGRTDHQVQGRGYRIELNEIDWAAKRNLDVAAVATVAFRKAGSLALAAFYCGEQPPDAVVAALRADLPGYMIPELVERVDRLPLNQNRKVDRLRLSRWAEAKGEKGELPWDESH